MFWLEKHSIFRLIFAFFYFILFIYIVRDFSWPNIFISLIMLFCCYISLVKANLIKDLNANGINNNAFDVISIIGIICLIIQCLL